MSHNKGEKNTNKLIQISLICLLIAVFITAIISCPTYYRKLENYKKIDINLKELNEKKEIKETIKKVSVVTTGDALIHSGVYKDAYNGTSYDFSKQFELVAPIISKYDIAYYNQETVFGGEELGYSNYPRFNTPNHLGIDMQEAGFNMVSLATNHSLDKNETGARNAVEFWNSQKNVLSSGMYLSEEDRLEDRIFEKNGITYTLLSYTTSTNGLPVPSGKDYLVNVYSEEKVKEDVLRYQDKVDIIFVAMHWGIEYTHTPNSEQVQIANYLANLGVEVVIGCHPHVIQPIEKIDNTLVIYSLGNFISAQKGEKKLVGMLAAFDITKTTKNNSSEIVINNIEVDLTWTYYKGFRQFKVVPFSIMEDKYLNNNETVYNKYKAIIEKSTVPVTIKGLKSGI
ncbi:MAG: CapA family protein [Bacilli bacterium]|nr:CapA family protein [Bacilli bacterium]